MAPRMFNGNSMGTHDSVTTSLTSQQANFRRPGETERAERFRRDFETKQSLRTFMADLLQDKVGGVEVLSRSSSQVAKSKSQLSTALKANADAATVRAADAAYDALSQMHRGPIEQIQSAKIRVNNEELVAFQVTNLGPWGKQTAATSALVDSSLKVVAMMAQGQWMTPPFEFQTPKREPAPLRAWSSDSKMAAATAVEQVEIRDWKQSTEVDRKEDGYFIGANGKIYSPETPIEQIPALKLKNAKGTPDLVLEVGGIMTDEARSQGSLHLLAQKDNTEVIGIRNATQGFWSDSLQYFSDLFGFGKNPATATLTRVIWSSLEKGQSVSLVGHSQGAQIVANTLENVQTMLKELGYADAEIKSMLSNIKVGTYGGAAPSFIDGPQYRHVINKLDLAPWLLGISPLPLHPFANPGEGAEIEAFTKFRIPQSIPFGTDSFSAVMAFFAGLYDESVHGTAVYYSHDTK